MDESARTSEHLARKLRTTFELQRFGIAMMRQNLIRRHPEASEDEIDARLRDWLHHRPGAEYGDAVGRPGTWPRSRA